MRFSKAFKKKSQRLNTIAFDLDGTLAEYGVYTEGQIGAPLQNTIETLKLLKNRGFDIMIFTSRDSEVDQEAIYKWIEDNELSNLIDDVEFGKPHYSVLIDDKNIEFTNQSIEELVEKAENFKPWWK